MKLYHFGLQAIGNVFFDKACSVLHWRFSARAKFEYIFEFFYNFVIWEGQGYFRSVRAPPARRLIVY